VYGLRLFRSAGSASQAKPNPHPCVRSDQVGETTTPWVGYGALRRKRSWRRPTHRCLQYAAPWVVAALALVLILLVQIVIPGHGPAGSPGDLRQIPTRGDTRRVGMSRPLRVGKSSAVMSRALELFRQTKLIEIDDLEAAASPNQATRNGTGSSAAAEHPAAEFEGRRAKNRGKRLSRQHRLEVQRFSLWRALSKEGTNQALTGAAATVDGPAMFMATVFARASRS